MRALLGTTASVVGALFLAGCSGSDAPSPAPRPTSVAELDPASMDLVRVDFCDLVTAKAVTAALGGAAAGTEDWDNGDEPPLPKAEADLAHEFGCSWTGADQTTARAWVFARPVDAAFGNQVIADGRGREGCTTQPAGFGDPGALQTCTTDAGTRVRYAGLFGTTWLTCEIAGAGSLESRADQWCAAVATALDN